MPIPGKHRRKKSGPIARGILAVGAGGAVVALPLLGATGAHAADQSASAAQSAPAAQQSAKTYKVVSGDYLAKIAAQHKIKGGWEKLYQDNREVVGGNPSLILPGMKLTLGAQASGSASTASSAKAEAPKTETKTAAKTEAKAAPATTTESAATTTKAADSNSTGWTTPVANATVTTQYHASGSMWSSGYHTGSDFSAATGTVVRAVGPGTVVSAGYDGAYGNEVIIKHADGMYSQYAHQSQLMVSVGQTVTGGQQIGLSGATGNVTGPHLHFEIRTTPSYGSDVDPIAYLRLHGVSI
ncbi:LysM peptidoglycan-binding domain-containing M23 family metallopeptidase [Streptomyces sp. NBC_00102]|uniref:LysM peptidoglycan-binding domain-containing M23 family metallopeptidase n=1 Tax=Streptomyces sp. NBC_00102 TaxID=2975652 RepID=UPI0022541B66|nr:LysM peptidoglycan-binding domain-containing M23 family metallopeptidase [Streptomyces sp. NBC_00102]MCX5401102.1 LysM peptidoglycan-binding domain-containing M23 family metallopeptidase [Streptomyces sp. NBC_00102]